MTSQLPIDDTVNASKKIWISINERERVCFLLKPVRAPSINNENIQMQIYDDSR